jgi:hypothetical protein
MTSKNPRKLQQLKQNLEGDKTVKTGRNNKSKKKVKNKNSKIKKKFFSSFCQFS